MDPRLKGSQLPSPELLAFALPKGIKDLSGFEEIQTFYPGMGVVCNLKSAPESDMWFNHAYRVIDVLEQESTTQSGPVRIQIEKHKAETGGELQTIQGFRKVTHLLDPVRWLQGKYSLPKHPSLPWHQDTWEAAWNKLHDPMNQAYVEAMATYAFSKLRETDVSPHFHLFYGSFCAKAKTYAYNITDSYMSYRHARWFWTGQEKKLFQLKVDDDVADEVKEALFQQPDELEDSSDEESESDSEEELQGLESEIKDTGSLHSASGSDFESMKEEESETESTEHTDDDEELKIFAEIKDFPVMMLYTEASEGTMDDLLDDEEEVGCEVGTAKWEQTWKAWIFQIMAALSVGQSLFGFTHNDLHSNNVVWSKTKLTHLYYKMRNGITFKVPTYGKLFRIIDFGRAIFRLNDHEFYSDDFKVGNDAAEQFHYGDLADGSEEEDVYPNPSFDLSRFTVSIFESIFPECPPIKKGGSILSEEPDLVVRETESELYNLLWSWLLCDDGHNVLMDPDGSERYPDFDLYKVITREVHNAVPADQFEKNLFKCFRVKDAGSNKVYSLFC